MNYGGMGHALEALTNHKKIPHGQAVALGILVENLISKKYLSLSENIVDDVFNIVKDIVSIESNSLKEVSNQSIIDVMRRDKKVEGDFLKLATISNYGDMKFIDFPLNNESEKLVNNFIEIIAKNLQDFILLDFGASRIKSVLYDTETNEYSNIMSSKALLIAGEQSQLAFFRSI